jgi:hypothetical protein
MSVKNEIQRHQEFQQQLRLALEDPKTAPGGVLDVSFLTRYFALAGLPVRRPMDKKTGKEASSYVRNTDEFALSINAPHLGVVGGKRGENFNVGVPWGPRARLLTVWLSTSAQDVGRSPDDRWVELGPIKPWLKSIGIADNGPARMVAKEQMVRLTFANFTMQVRKSGLDLFSNERLVDKAVFSERDLANYAANRMADVRWPLGVQLSQTAFKNFREGAVAIPTNRLAKVSHSAMAIDTLIYLCYKLPLIDPGDEELVTWRQLAAQFGSREAPSKFKENFLHTVRAARDAYPEANVELREDTGLLMRHSDPAVLRRAFVSMSSLHPVQRRQRRNRILPPTPGDEP